MAHRSDFPLEMRWLDALNFILPPPPPVSVGPTSQMFYPLFVITSHFFQAQPWALIEAPPIHLSRVPFLSACFS
jgi:hypothetical protein